MSLPSMDEIMNIEVPDPPNVTALAARTPNTTPAGTPRSGNVPLFTANQPTLVIPQSMQVDMFNSLQSTMGSYHGQITNLFNELGTKSEQITQLQLDLQHRTNQVALMGTNA